MQYLNQVPGKQLFTRSFQKYSTTPEEEDIEVQELIKKWIPADAEIIHIEINAKNIRIRYALTTNLTEDRIRYLLNTMKPVELNRKNIRIDNSNNKTKRVKCRDNVMAILNIADFHLNRKIWGRAGFNEDYTLAVASEVFKDIIDESIARLKSSPYNIEKIVLNTGGDFFNSDTIDGTTTKGTIQFNDGTWQEAYLVAQELLAYAILKLSNIAPVYHYYVSGNHDTMAGFYLVSWLKAYFRGYENIFIDDNPKIRQTIEYKNNIIVLAHGDDEKRRAIDLPFTEVDAKSALSRATNLEVLTGHMHSVSVQDKNGVRWEVLGCACPVGDAWTYAKGYGSTRSEATIMYYNEVNRVQQDTIDTKDILRKIKEG